MLVDIIAPFRIYHMLPNPSLFIAPSKRQSSDGAGAPSECCHRFDESSSSLMTGVSARFEEGRLPGPTSPCRFGQGCFPWRIGTFLRHVDVHDLAVGRGQVVVQCAELIAVVSQRLDVGANIGAIGRELGDGSLTSFNALSPRPSSNRRSCMESPAGIV